MNKIIILLLVSSALFMEAVDTSIINTAIPVMAKSFNVIPIELKFALISYLLSLAIFIPISGWIADKYGIKKVFISAITLFTLSSAWCGFTESINELIFARIIQGIGGSLTMPVGRLIILRTFQRQELVSRMSIVVMVAAFGLMLGPLLGGIIVAHFSWRWIFWVNIPAGALTVVLGLSFLPEMPSILVPPLDKMGFFLFGSGLALLTYGLSTLSESSIYLTESLLIIILASLLFVCYIRHSRHKAYPVVKTDLLSIRTFRVSVIANLLVRISFGGIPFLLPLLLQIVLGFSPRLSGLLLTPIAVGVLLSKPLSIHILRLLGYKTSLILNTALVSLSLMSFSIIDQNTSIYTIGLCTFVYGFLIALQYTDMSSLAYANIRDDNISAATSIMSTIQQVALSFGVAISAIIISFFSNSSMGHSVLTLKVFHQTFITLSILTLCSGFIFFSMNKDDGAELIAK